ncbi:MAG TPA: NAD(P)-dependent alcohol dehydrogenase [Blastocatellia bacterium]|nr:NAD(P)-dependent alcohol dehydrogenase [Blastocatellia bacterium]
MKAIEIQNKFGLDSLALVERPEPTPGPGEALIRVRATSLNYRDLLTVEGRYNPKQPLPLVPLSDGVGEVVAVGEGVTRVKVGDRVAANFSQGWIAGEPTRDKLRASLGGPLDGMLVEYRALREEGLVHVPEHLSDEEAASLPCAAVTAWHALIVQGNLKAGATVLVQGTGGVSLFALQFAVMAGARVIVTSSSDEKLERARALGASDGINYKTTPDWDKAARDLTGGVGVDHIVEVGGAGTFAKSLRAIRIGGHISVIGNLAGNTGDLSLIPILMQNLRVQGVLVGSREMFEAMNRAIALHKMKPVVDKVFPMEEARAAFEHMAAGAHFGKIAVRLREG